MRVAFVVEKFPNVSETFILDEIVGLLQRGVEVDIFALRRGTEADVHPTYITYGLEKRTFYCVPAIHGRVARLFAAVPASLSTLRRNPLAFVKCAVARKRGIQSRTFISLGRAFINSGRRYDIIHAHFGPNGIRAEVLRNAKALRAPIITTFHGYDATSFVVDNGPMVYHDLAKHGERFIAVSQSIARQIGEIGFPVERTEIMPLGVDCGSFTPSTLSDGRKDTRIVSVGRFVEKKGFEYGIRAVVDAHQMNPGISYDIIGDGKLRPVLEALIERLGATDFVKLHGYRNQAQVGEIIGESDVMLAPSVTAADGDQESMPIVVKEAMACGLPVIGSRHAGIPEIVCDGVTGLLADERDVATLAQHLISLANDSRRRRELGEAGRRVIEAKFNNEVLVDGLLSLYKTVAEESRTQSAMH